MSKTIPNIRVIGRCNETIHNRKKSSQQKANAYRKKATELEKFPDPIPERKQKEIIVCYTKAMELDPEKVVLYLADRSKFYHRIGKNEAAIADIKKIEDLPPFIEPPMSKTTPNIRVIGWCNETISNSKKPPQQKANAYREKAKELEKLPDPIPERKQKEIIHSYTKAMELDPEKLLIYLADRSKFYHRIGKNEAAIADIKEIESLPQDNLDRIAARYVNNTVQNIKNVEKVIKKVEKVKNNINELVAKGEITSDQAEAPLKHLDVITKRVLRPEPSYLVEEVKNTIKEPAAKDVTSKDKADNNTLICFDFDKTLVNGHFHNNLATSKLQASPGLKQDGVVNFYVNGQRHTDSNINEQQQKINNDLQKAIETRAVDLLSDPELGLKNKEKLKETFDTLLKQGHNIAITSSSSYPDVIPKALEALGLTTEQREKINIIAGFAHERGTGKQEHIEAAMKLVDIKDPKKVMLIDDDPDNITKARQAGMRTVMVSYRINPDPGYLNDIVQQATEMQAGVLKAPQQEIASSPLEKSKTSEYVNLSGIDAFKDKGVPQQPLASTAAPKDTIPEEPKKKHQGAEEYADLSGLKDKAAPQQTLANTAVLKDEGAQKPTNYYWKKHAGAEEYADLSGMDEVIKKVKAAQQTLANTAVPKDTIPEEPKKKHQGAKEYADLSALNEYMEKVKAVPQQTLANTAVPEEKVLKRQRDPNMYIDISNMDEVIKKVKAAQQTLANTAVPEEKVPQKPKRGPAVYIDVSDLDKFIKVNTPQQTLASTAVLKDSKAAEHIAVNIDKVIKKSEEASVTEKHDPVKESGDTGKPEKKGNIKRFKKFIRKKVSNIIRKMHKKSPEAAASPSRFTTRVKKNRGR